MQNIYIVHALSGFEGNTKHYEMLSETMTLMND